MRKGEKLQKGLSRDAYCYIDEGIKSYYGLIFNPSVTLEWVEGKATIADAREIAAVIDSARLKYVLEGDTFIYTREVLDQCRQQDRNIQVPDFPILQNLSDNGTLSTALGILATQVPDYLEEDQRRRAQQKGEIPVEIPVVSARRWVEETFTWNQKNPEISQKRIDVFKAALSEDINRKSEYFADPQRYRRDWIKRFLKIDRILKAFNPQNNIDIDRVLERIDFTKCPAVKLYWNVRDKRMKSGNPPQDNDVDDYVFLSGVPHPDIDIVLTERNLRAFILQADDSLKSKVFYKASDALSVLENEGFIY